MGSIRTGIELNDQFTSVIYGIINSVQLAVASMGDMQQCMSEAYDIRGIEGARESINQATIAMEELNAAMQEQAAPSFAAPVVPAPILPTTVPEPVRIPVIWETDGLDVFTGTGVERFQQEVQSTNMMLDQLCDTQDAIAKQAYQTRIFPPEAFQNLNSMAVRIDTVREKIRQIENNPVNIGTSAANAELEQLRSTLYQTLQEQNQLNDAMQRMDVSAANEAYLRLSKTVSTTERYIRDNVDAQGAFNQQIRDGTTGTSLLMGSIKGIAAAYISIQGLKKALDMSDAMAQTTARLNIMNDGAQTTQQLTDMIYQSAQRSRAPFLDTANAISKMGINAGAAFDSNGELIAFMEQVNKQFKIGGATATEQSNAMIQLSQAMAAGALRGEELNSILDGAPGIARAIEQNMGWAEGSIKSYAEQGAVTAEVVKNSMLNMADETNARFDSMPRTFSDAMTDIKNTAVQYFRPVMTQINEIANSAEFQTCVDGLLQALSIVATVAGTVVEILSAGGAFIVDNWSVIAPILLGVAAALAVYTTALIAHNVVQGIGNLLKGISTLQSNVHAAALAMETGATFSATAAQYGFNAALLACPVTWIIIAIIALIAIFYLVVAAINKIQGTTISATGVITGALSAFAAFIWNLFSGILELVLGVIEFLTNRFINFANFLGNFLNNPIASIIYLFQGMADTVLGIIEKIASAMDFVFGSNMADTVSGWRNGLQDIADAAVKKYAPDKDYQKVFESVDLSMEGFGIRHWSYKDAYNSGYDWGQGVENQISDFFCGFEDFKLDDYGGYSGNGMAENLNNIANDTANISDSLDVSEEDLKYLRDIAEQEAINRFTTSEIRVEMNNNNTVNNTNDLDGIVDGLTTKVLSAMEVVRAGT